jgi:hypothetical protein
LKKGLQMPSKDSCIRPASAGRALPARLRRALETLSGYGLRDVRVHEAEG